MITRLTEKIWIVEGGKGGRFPYSHSLYIRDGGGFLIDAGSDRSEIERLRKEEGISGVVMTHYHEDHFAFLSALRGVEMWATEEDAPALESLDVLLSRCGILGTEWDAPIRKVFLEKFHFHPTKATRTVSDGEELWFGGTRAIAVVAPGHTAGHLCLNFPDDGILFLGDYDLSDFGPWYGGGQGIIDSFRRSARHLAGIGAKMNVVSHEEPIRHFPIEGAVEKYLSIIDRREEGLREYLREPRTKAEIIARRLVYGPGYEGPWFDCGEWSVVSAHLADWVGRGEAIAQDGFYLLT